MNQNGGIHKGGFAVLCHRNGGSESPGILNDMFRIGDDLDEDDLIRDSMGKFGTVLFIPKVYVVKSNSELYDCVNSWPLNGVKQSNGLKSCKANTKLEEAFKNVPAFERDIFRHDWKFDDPEDIYAVSKGTTFHTLRRKQKSRKHNMRCLFPLFFLLEYLYFVFLCLENAHP